MRQKILIFGPGWLGHKYGDFFHDKDGYEANIWRTDIASRADVAADLYHYKPSVVINTAGKTGRPNIDWCESHREETWRSNVEGPKNLAELCAANGVYLVHLSSGCIFNGISPDPDGWTEDDAPNPVSFYTETKVAGDDIVRQYPVLILRIRMPVDKYPSERNLISKLARYPKIINVLNSVTVIDDLLDTTLKLIEARRTGIYNIVNEGPITHQEIMSDYVRIVDPMHCYELISVEELYEQGLVITGRSNCILSTDKLKKEGIVLPNSMARIRMCLEEYKNHLKPLL